MPDWVFCSNEWQRCNFEGPHEVRYGKDYNGDVRWTAPQMFTGGVDCNNDIFGDPHPGVTKECQIRPFVPPVTVEPEPEPTTTPTTTPAPTQQPAGMSNTTLYLIIGGVLLLMMGSGGGKRR